MKDTALLLTKVISGGQTGVDRAALQAAQDARLTVGGWCPPGRVCKGGIIPEHFALQETPYERSERAPDVPHSLRTEWNVRDADGTLILYSSSQVPSDPGTLWTQQVADRLHKPLVLMRLPSETAERGVLDWLAAHSIRILNVAGPSENLPAGTLPTGRQGQGTAPGIGKLTHDFLYSIFQKSV